MTVTTYIGLGSNLGDSRQILSEAIAKLKSLGEVKVSKLYQSPHGSPRSAELSKCSRSAKTELLPLDLLDQLQRFEQEAGRVRLRHWGANFRS